MEEFVPIISQVGFPIAVAAYTLVRLDKTIREHTKVLQTISARLGVIENGTGKGD